MIEATLVALPLMPRRQGQGDAQPSDWLSVRHQFIRPVTPFSRSDGFDRLPLNRGHRVSSDEVLEAEFCDEEPQPSKLIQLATVIDVEWQDVHPPISARSFQPSPQHSPYRTVCLLIGLTGIMATAGFLAETWPPPAHYQGTFQITPTVKRSSTVTLPISQTLELKGKQKSEMNGVWQKVLLTSDRLRVLQSPMVLQPVVEQLQANQVAIEYDTLVKHLQLSIDAANQLTVTYRDRDPVRAQQITEQLARTYLDYQQQCHDSACRGIQFIEEKLPVIQQRLQTLQTQILNLRQSQGEIPAEQQLEIVMARSADLAQQAAELEGAQITLAQTLAQQQLDLGLPAEDTTALDWLNQDPTYAVLLQQFNALTTQMAAALSQIPGDPAALQTLYTQQETLQEELLRTVAAIAQRDLVTSDAGLSIDPAFSETEAIQQWLKVAHSQQVLNLRQAAIAQAQQAIAQQQQALTQLIRQDAELHQQLQAETQIWQDYLYRLAGLQAASPAQAVTWHLVAPPDVIAESWMPALNVSPEVQRSLTVAALAGMLLSIGLATALEKRKAIAQAIHPLRQPYVPSALGVVTV